jgi:hypothetical protein
LIPGPISGSIHVDVREVAADTFYEKDRQNSAVGSGIRSKTKVHHPPEIPRPASIANKEVCKVWQKPFRLARSPNRHAVCFAEAHRTAAISEMGWRQGEPAAPA